MLDLLLRVLSFRKLVPFPLLSLQLCIPITLWLCPILYIKVFCISPKLWSYKSVFNDWQVWNPKVFQRIKSRFVDILCFNSHFKKVDFFFAFGQYLPKTDCLNIWTHFSPGLMTETNRMCRTPLRDINCIKVTKLWKINIVQ